MFVPFSTTNSATDFVIHSFLKSKDKIHEEVKGKNLLCIHSNSWLGDRISRQWTLESPLHTCTVRGSVFKCGIVLDIEHVELIVSHHVLLSIYHPLESPPFHCLSSWRLTATCTLLLSFPWQITTDVASNSYEMNADVSQLVSSWIERRRTVQLRNPVIWGRCPK